MWETMLHWEWVFRIFGFIAFLSLCILGAVGLVIYIIYAAAGTVYGEIEREAKAHPTSREASRRPPDLPKE